VTIISYSMACLPQLGSVPAAYTLSSLAAVIGLSNNDVISLRSLHCVRCVGWKPRFNLILRQLSPGSIAVATVAGCRVLLTCDGEDAHLAIAPNFVLRQQVGQQHQHPAVILELSQVRNTTTPIIIHGVRNEITTRRKSTRLT